MAHIFRDAGPYRWRRYDEYKATHGSESRRVLRALQEVGNEAGLSGGRHLKCSGRSK
jgi:hypothetical protein